MLDYKCPGSPSTGFNVCGLIERHETGATGGRGNRICLKVVVGSVAGGVHVLEPIKNKLHLSLLLLFTSRSVCSIK